MPDLQNSILLLLWWYLLKKSWTCFFYDPKRIEDHEKPQLFGYSTFDDDALIWIGHPNVILVETLQPPKLIAKHENVDLCIRQERGRKISYPGHLPQE